MKNKELALTKLEQVNNAISNLKSSVNRRDYSVEHHFERLQNLLEELEGIISIEQETFLTRGYEGI